MFASMTAAPHAIVDTLNGLLEGHLNSVFHFVLTGSPYLTGATPQVQALLHEVLQACHRETEQLVKVIESLGGVPRVRNCTPAEEQYLSYLSLKFLLPTLVKEKDLLLTRYENAEAAIGSEYPEVIETLRAIEREQRCYLRKLTDAAVEITGGKFVPPAHGAARETSKSETSNPRNNDD